MSKTFGRDEMNSLIGGPATGTEEMAAFRQCGGHKKNPHQSSRITAVKEADISIMTAAETAKMLIEKNKKSNSVAVRYRSKNKVLAHHQLLAEELSKQQQQKSGVSNQILQTENLDNEGDDDNNDVEFLSENRRVQSAVVIGQRSTVKERRRRRRRSNSSSSSSSFSSDDGEIQRRERNSNNRQNRRDRRRRGSSSSSSSSSSSDEGNDRRRNRRVLASLRMLEEPAAIVPQLNAQLDPKNAMKVKDKHAAADEEVASHEYQRIEEKLKHVKRERMSATVRSRTPQTSSNDENSDSSSSSSSSSSGSSSSSSSSSEEDEPVRLKPVFVPKHKRNLMKSEEKKLEEMELKLQREKEWKMKRKADSRALLAKELDTSNVRNQDVDDDQGDEYGGAINKPPNDDDEIDENKERNRWEIREIDRLLKSIDIQEAHRREKEEYDRRKRLTDAECLKEDIESGRYQAPGAVNSRNAGSASNSSSGPQRFFHRGAYYMDDSEWDEGDIRQKAKEYAAAATGEDKIDKSKLPEVMQVKNFGRSSQNTRYKGLAKEDTTDKYAQRLPLAIKQRPKW